jgi:hypothetical protein
MFEETTRILFCSDLFHQWGVCDPLTSGDIVERARNALLESEAGPFANYVPYTHHTGRVLNELATYAPQTLAAMHGSSFSGNCGQALRDLATVMAEVLGPNREGIQTTPGSAIAAQLS